VRTERRRAVRAAIDRNVPAAVDASCGDPLLLDPAARRPVPQSLRRHRTAVGQCPGMTPEECEALSWASGARTTGLTSSRGCRSERAGRLWTHPETRSRNRGSWFRTRPVRSGSGPGVPRVCRIEVGRGRLAGLFRGTADHGRRSVRCVFDQADSGRIQGVALEVQGRAAGARSAGPVFRNDPWEVSRTYSLGDAVPGRGLSVGGDEPCDVGDDFGRPFESEHVSCVWKLDELCRRRR
jgi:hypothetical protein